MPPILWLTYCWRDNETMDVDYVVRQIEQKGIRRFLKEQLLKLER